MLAAYSSPWPSTYSIVVPALKGRRVGAMGPGWEKTSEGFLDVAEKSSGRDYDGRYRCQSE
jgi:hypothetical protein